MNWDAWILSAIFVAAYFWIESRLRRIVEELETANETLASILNKVQK
jgi:hypothetical protein